MKETIKEKKESSKNNGNETVCSIQYATNAFINNNSRNGDNGLNNESETK